MDLLVCPGQLSWLASGTGRGDAASAAAGTDRKRPASDLAGEELVGFLRGEIPASESLQDNRHRVDGGVYRSLARVGSLQERPSPSPPSHRRG